MSTIYYAMFHCLARDGADLLIGGARSDRSLLAWRQIYRALDHGSIKRRCSNSAMIARFPAAVAAFATALVDLQGKRHEADYDPFTRLDQSAIAVEIDDARLIIADYRTASVKDRRAFCAFVLFENRSAR